VIGGFGNHVMYRNGVADICVSNDTDGHGAIGGIQYDMDTTMVSTLDFTITVEQGRVVPTRDADNSLTLDGTSTSLAMRKSPHPFEAIEDETSHPGTSERANPSPHEVAGW